MPRIWWMIFQITRGLDVEIAGAGAFSHSPALIFDSTWWSHAQDVDGRFEGSPHIFSGILSPLQSVQRANIMVLS